MSTRFHLIVPILACAVITPLPAGATSPLAPGIAERIDRLEREVDAAFRALPELPGVPRPEPVPAQWGGWGQPQQDDSSVRLNQLEGRIRQLNGQIEQLQHQIRRMEDQLRRFQEDTEFRFQEMQGQGGQRRPAPPAQQRPPQQPPQQRGDVQPPPAEAAPLPAPAAVPPAPRTAAAPPPPQTQQLGTPPQNLGTLPGDPRTGQPLDLTAGTGIGLPPPAAVAPPPPAQVAGLPPAPRPPAGAPAPQTQPRTARESYDLAYGHFLRGEYDQAESAFGTFLAAHPSDRQAGDALFWLGESHYLRRQWREAAEAFLRSYNEFPNGSKAPESLLRLGMSLRQLGQRDAACASFAEVLRRYPRAPQSVRQRVQTEQRGATCA